MGLFSRKKDKTVKPAQTVSKTTAVNADDIWNAPVKKQNETVTVKESKYSPASTEEIKGVAEVDPEELKEKMAALDREVEEKKSVPEKTYHDYDVNPVGNGEIVQAQEKYEKDYEIMHDKFVATHKEDISVASLEDIDSRLKAMIDEHSNKLHEMENMDFDFKSVSNEEVEKKLADLPYAVKEEDMEHYKDIEEISVSQDAVDKLGHIDHSGDFDEIGEVTSEQLAQTMAEFEKNYPDKK